ncbi:MAG TPA: DUF433 domain-containing protein [Lacipirellulaceae bacterium]|nr:DUF433 domain-containing protein [Lacipirellulaceae bacterium]
MSTVAHPHIEITADGHARIRGTGFKVRVLAEEYLEGATPAKLQEWHPQLTPAQIHDALAYYYDNRQTFDAEIARLSRLAEEMFANRGESLLEKKLRELGRELP